MINQEILSTLLLYQLRLMNITGFSPQPEFTIDAANEYSFITITIQKSGRLYAQVSFEVRDTSGKLHKIYCEDHAEEQRLTKLINTENWPGLQSPTGEALPYTREVLQSLTVADSIAALTVNCARGDNYRPGNFSKVAVNGHRILLEQINYMNAKSLDHKNDYSMRSLVFTIPLEQNAAMESSFNTFHIGNMTVKFSDNSSENNRACGNKVQAVLNELAGK